MARRRVLVTLTDLHAGGAQRVVLTLLHSLSRDDFELHLALVERSGEFLGEVPADIPVHDLGARRVRRAAGPLLALARRLRPDVLFSTLYHLNHLLLLLRPLLPRGTKLVVREGITASQALPTDPRPLLTALLFRMLYRFADRVVCQCDYMREDLANSFGVPRSKLTTIYNPIDVEAVRARARDAPNPFEGKGAGPHVVAAGRLAPQKGFDILLRAFPALLALYPDAQLWILGADPQDPPAAGRELAELARRLGIEARAHLTGFDPNPYAYLDHADLFVLSSRYEGLPNVLLEALALGCPVVALDRPGGTREIMERTGQLERLRAELDWKPEWFRGRGAASPPADLSAFSLERGTRRYAELLAGV